LAHLRTTRSRVSVRKPPSAREPSRSARVVGPDTVHGRSHIVEANRDQMLTADLIFPGPVPRIPQENPGPMGKDVPGGAVRTLTGGMLVSC
jgi:hypothetical protein